MDGSEKSKVGKKELVRVSRKSISRSPRCVLSSNRD